MITQDQKARWELLQICVKDESFTVQDNLAKKKRVYHVPHLIHAELLQQSVYIFTSDSKIMQLNLQTASRQFLSPPQLESLKKIQKTHNKLHAKNNSSKKVKPNLSNLVSMPRFAFSNTVIAY